MPNVKMPFLKLDSFRVDKKSTYMLEVFSFDIGDAIPIPCCWMMYIVYFDSDFSFHFDY